MRVTRNTLAAAVVALVIVVAFAVIRGRGGVRPLVVLISIDTLRADRLGCYGYTRPTSPAIDAFRGDSVLFQQAIAQAPSTLPSHASMLSSLLPHEHGASIARKSRLPEAVVTLPEILRANGYATVAYSGYGQLDPAFGLNQGFELYERVPSDEFASTVKAAIRWLRRKPDRPAFLFLHTYETHHPYAAAPQFLEPFDTGYDGRLPRRIEIDLLKRINRGEVALEERDLEHIRDAYDAEIRSMDEAFGRLLRFLRKRGLYDGALIVLTSDHGEEFGEHGKVGWHSHSLYDELLKVPLVVKLPGSAGAGKTIASQVRSIDIAPTVLAALGLASPAAFRGTNLLDRLESSEAPPLEAVSERDSPRIDVRRSSLRTGEWKMFGARLFDLVRDPGERTDVATEHPEVARELTARLSELLDSRPAGPPSRAEPDEKTLERLKALGYVD
jgi:arylsulfatase A-like enzyme